MADLSIKNLGIGLASSLLAGAISVAAATGVGASTARTDSPAGSYVYTESNQTSASGGNSVLAFLVASGGSLTSIGSFATGGDGTGAGLGSQGAVTLADGALRPLAAVREATRRMARGDAPALVETSRRDEIGGVAESVNELAQSLQRLEELRRQVTNDAAHELRTPLHNLLGLIEGMRDGVIPPSPARLQQAHSELGRLIALVEDLRGLADAQLARDRMARAPVDVRAVVRDVVVGFDASMERHQLTWQIDAPEGGLTVDGDAGRLGQIVGNIVDNAIRFARAGTVISVSLARRGPSVRVSVHDIGETIDDHSLPHIFERFFRADPSRARGSGGAGIGLAIVRELVSAHGGDVGADSDSDGVTVWFDLPLRAPDPDPTTFPDPARSIPSFDAATRA
jgi:two-component system, OmpR family, sensor histidine kinase BaeS